MGNLIKLIIDKIEHGYRLSEDEFQKVTFDVKKEYLRKISTRNGLTNDEYKFLYLYPELEKYYKNLRREYFIKLKEKNLTDLEFNKLSDVDKGVYTKTMGELKMAIPHVLKDKRNKKYYGMFYYYKNGGYKDRFAKWRNSLSEEEKEKHREYKKEYIKTKSKSDRYRIQASLYSRKSRENRKAYKTNRRWYNDCLFVDRKTTGNSGKRTNALCSILSRIFIWVSN